MCPSSGSTDDSGSGPADAFTLYGDGDWDGAIRLIRAVLKRNQDAGNPSGESHSWLFMGLVRYKAGAMEESSVCMGAALAGFSRSGDHHGIGRCHRWLARINERTGNFKESERQFLLSWSAYVGCGDHAAVAAVSLDIGDMLYLQNDSDGAATWWIRSWNTAASQHLDAILDAVSDRFGLWCKRFFGAP